MVKGNKNPVSQIENGVFYFEEAKIQKVIKDKFGI